MQKENESGVTISDLPNEIVTIILQNNNCKEILSVGSTCKRFNDMINNNQCLWKAKFKFILPADLFEIVSKHSNGDWLSETKFFFNLKQKLYAELISMSPKYYWRQSDITSADDRIFFTIALSNNLSYYYTIYILQDAIKKCQKELSAEKCEKPFTLTEAHYAKVALRHLIHTFLAIKWVRSHIQNELTPEIVINFFLQWIDTDNLHSDENVENEISELVKSVDAILDIHYPSKPSSSGMPTKDLKGPIYERKVLAAVTQVLYHQMRMVVTSSANLDTLNIVKILNNRCGNGIAVAAVYQAVAKRFGVQCELVAFPNHLFLEWRDKFENEIPQVYTIDLSTGELRLKRRCPFSQSPNSNYKYYPDSLLQYVYSSYHLTMGAITNWNTQNALHLLDFLGTYDSEYNPYRNFLPYLFDLTHIPAMNTPLNLKYLHSTHFQIIHALSQLNNASKTVNRSVVVKRRQSNIKFAVGMICYHKKYHYVCIIRHWDPYCAIEWQRRMEIETLEFGPNQPFYHVISVDHSERYVAQENLIEKTSPSRLFYLEDLIAREFTHFDGFAYVPNDEKRLEYPEDTPVTNFFRDHCELKTHRTTMSSVSI